MSIRKNSRKALLPCMAAMAVFGTLGPAFGEEEARDHPPGDETEPAFVFDERAGRALLGLRVRHQSPPVEACIPPAWWQLILVERDVEGRVEVIAEGVGLAAYSDDGSIFYVRDQALLEFDGEESRLIARPVMHDFAVQPGGMWIAVVRPGEEPDGELVLLARDGRSEERVDPGDGVNALPVFTPDGKRLVFLSSVTGVAALWRVDLEGDDARPVQITNFESRPGALGPSFVPPPNSRAGMHFVDESTLVYDAGGLSFWAVDIETGRSRPLEGTR